MSRWMRAAYRKEPISGFLAIAAGVDLAIGGISGRWSLFFLGLLAFGGAATWRWWRVQQAKELRSSTTIRYLPQGRDRALPSLSRSKSRHR